MLTKMIPFGIYHEVDPSWNTITLIFVKIECSVQKNVLNKTKFPIIDIILAHINSLSKLRTFRFAIPK